MAKIDASFSTPGRDDEFVGIVPDGLIPADADRQTRLLFTARYLYSENQKLQRRLRIKEEQVQELVTEKLIWGSGFTGDSTEDLAEKYGLDLDEGVFLLMLVRLLGVDASRQRLTVRTILDRLFADGFKLSYTTARGEDVALLSLGHRLQPEEAAAEVYDIAVKACEEIEKSRAGKAIICVSVPATDADSIRGSFKTLMDLREYSMSLPETSRLITTKDFPNYVPFDPDARPFMALSVEKQYINAVIARDFDLACQLTLEKIDSLLADSINGHKSLKPFLESRMEATADLLMVGMNAVSAGGKSVEDDIKTFKETADTEVILQAIEDIFYKLDCFFNHSESEIKGTAGKVIKFVSANYHNPSLSVEIICDEMGKSRSYLSRMFKENTGMNLLDYLHTTRITEAKKLLTETSLSVAEIGEKVGYYSGWTLARVFKRYEGITPSAYREAYRKADEDSLIG